VRAEADALPVTAAAVDVVVSSFGVPHFPDPEAFFGESWRVLRPAGRFAFTVWAPPERGTAMAAVFDALARHGTLDVGLPAEPDLFRYADRAGVTRSLTAAGFVDVSTTVVPLIWELPGPDAVVDALLHGTVRIRALLMRQPAGVLARVRESVRKELAGHLEGEVVRVPRPAVLVRAAKP
jgi:SAM-dependent methyltransferase